MSSPASIKKHPIHPMLVTVPIGLWLFSLVCDIAFKIWGGESWAIVARYTMGGGIVGALLAAVPGLIDYKALRDPQVTKIATAHMTINLVAVALYTANLWMRTRNPNDDQLPPVPFALSIIAVLLLLVSGWLGGEMIYKHGVGVEPQNDTPAEAHAKDRI
ncbi:MAG TPA: DUF2231 domain-containing protein [Abditibacteriaceae bacterium]|nr:DUF2231 domain-containing protein [Abditibacteriaceae bacterium]